MIRLALFVALLSAVPAQAQKPVQGPQPLPKAVEAKPQQESVIVTPKMAVAWAHDDAAPLGPQDSYHQFYLWFLDASPKQKPVVDYVLNTAVSHSSNIYQSVSVAGGKVVRIDKRELCPNPSDRARLDNLLENVLPFFEPYTHRANLGRGKDGGFAVKVNVPAYVANDGKTYRHRIQPIRPQEQFAPHTGIDKMLGLYTLLQTNLPIARADWFCCVCMSTQKVGRADGIYYSLQGWKAGVTTQDDVLRELGAGEDQIQEQKLTLVEQVKKAGNNIARLFAGTSRAGIFDSGVTFSGRRADSFQGTKVRPAAGVGTIFLTHDLDRKSVDPEQSPTQNLVVFKDDGREGIGLKANGHQIYWASNGQGILVLSVPEGIARDTTVPAHAPGTLEPGFSCAICHGDADGYKTIPNDLLALSKERIPTDDPAVFDRVNVFDDDALAVTLGYTREQTLEILRGLFGLDMDQATTFARIQHANAVQQSAGISVLEVTAGLAEMRRYVFDAVTSERALLEVGVRFEPQYTPEQLDGPNDSDAVKKAKAKIREVVRIEQLKEAFQREVPALPKVKGISVEHPSINPLRGGRWSVTRAEYENVFPDLMGRRETMLAKAQTKEREE